MIESKKKLDSFNKNKKENLQSSVLTIDEALRKPFNFLDKQKIKEKKDIIGSSKTKENHLFENIFETISKKVPTFELQKYLKKNEMVLSVIDYMKELAYTDTRKDLAILQSQIESKNNLV